jgi:hypothetical protein
MRHAERLFAGEFYAKCSTWNKSPDEPRIGSLAQLGCLRRGFACGRGFALLPVKIGRP